MERAQVAAPWASPHPHPQLRHCFIHYFLSYYVTSVSRKNDIHQQYYIPSFCIDLTYLGSQELFYSRMLIARLDDILEMENLKICQTA